MPTMINFKDLKCANGKTIEENNLNVTHKEEV